ATSSTSSTSVCSAARRRVRSWSTSRCKCAAKSRQGRCSLLYVAVVYPPSSRSKARSDALEVAVPTGATGKTRGAVARFGGAKHLDAEPRLFLQRRALFESPLPIGGAAVAAHAALREAQQEPRELERALEPMARLGESIREAERERLAAGYTAPGQDHVQRAAPAHPAPEPDRAA